MGLLSIIKKQKLKDKEIRCLILGLDNSGKSTVVNKLLPDNEKDDNITPTMGFQIKTIEIDSMYNVSIWDIGGQTTLRPFWDNYFDKTDVLIWCIDITSNLRFTESLNELKDLIQRDEGRIGYDCHVIILMNKIDLLNNDQAMIGKHSEKIKNCILRDLQLTDNEETTETEKMRKKKVRFH
ncbi:hypothetical protein KAFR_0B05110 [Kazachstania africana CBS 2517]|uniref:GTP-binding protein n=1 Tax=Kazachstania africana (strain ATCC 22294 / BCRC 22015 / CBS 2517 / CECT 1963 / NBRC 1671 / NRRL Y-8276) TaxID=1071382 RepID=H2AR07_KAZAF|nr:hypothetical protein KAFR_0B05110 [Kazachstania africana CBS 2517]CCF56807.1 hypothetical protein KAFR_0B05110 [Kazachstania africana CBS 2517]